MLLVVNMYKASLSSTRGKDTRYAACNHKETNCLHNPKTVSRCYVQLGIQERGVRDMCVLSHH
jgi:hypothetical protein